MLKQEQYISSVSVSNHQHQVASASLHEQCIPLDINQLIRFLRFSLNRSTNRKNILLSPPPLPLPKLSPSQYSKGINHVTSAHYIYYVCSVCTLS
uniref:Uncharacterized protein n=1 Tax=Parascaris equorum TaxID=6256 RepID=A0A914RWB0_PAREQ